MAMKFTVTFLLLISIGEIYSKTLLEKIRDDSDLSQVSQTILVGLPPREVTSGSHLRTKKEGRRSKKLEKFLASARKKALHNRKKKRVLCNTSGNGGILVEVTIISGEDS